MATPTACVASASDHLVAQRADEALADRARGFLIDIAGQHRELIAAQAGEDIVGARRTAEASDDRLQHLDRRRRGHSDR